MVESLLVTQKQFSPNLIMNDLDRFKKGLNLNIASLSDVHLGHNSTPTAHIIHNLKTWVIPFNEESAKLDIIFIAGDFFDRLLDALSPELREIRTYVVELIYFCKRNSIKLRVLRGTRLHDWDQSYIFVEENENHNIGCDLLYVDNVHIEHMEEHGVDILYIPDEVNPLDASKTWAIVEKLMADHSLEKVDYAVMHGAFTHQMPDFPELRLTFHDPDLYRSIVRHYILIGHIHKFTNVDRIIAHGSTDRLKHGEEEAKGHIRINRGKVRFVENKGAMKYTTLDVSGDDADIVIEKVIKVLNNSEKECRIRLVCGKDSVAYGMQRRLETRFHFVKFTFQVPKVKKDKPVPEFNQTTGELQLFPKLTIDNMEEAILKELAAFPDQLERCSTIIRNVINATKA